MIPHDSTNGRFFEVGKVVNEQDAGDFAIVGVRGCFEILWDLPNDGAV